MTDIIITPRQTTTQKGMTMIGVTGYIIASAYHGISNKPLIWRLRASHAPDSRPDARCMNQYRQAFRGQHVRSFTEAEWDALPYGEQDRDWVYVLNQKYPREADGIRPV